MSITVFTNAFLIDGTGAEPKEGAAVVVEDERIKEVVAHGKVGALSGPVTTLDLKGATLMPGLTDAHVHICAVTENITDQHRFYPPSYIAARAMQRAEECLMQGFTTVRDAGGADYGFRMVLEEGHVPGPRLLVSGHYISQTGGHGDKRRRAEWIAPLDCCVGMIGSIADGEAEVRRAVREQLRRDVDQIKIMASGGAMSPSDELDTTQFTVAEMRAAVEEAQAVGKYVLSHAYSDTAVRNAIAAGVRSIEHGNLIREPAARAIKEADAFLVPTMVTYEAIYREGKRYGIGDHQVQKIDLARQQSLRGLEYAYRAGCKIGSGSDLLGDMMVQRAVEFELKGEVMKPMEVLLSATKVNAELFRMSDKIGSVEPGKYADLIVVAGNPLKNLRVFQPLDNLKLIMKGGRLFKRTL
ncbi:MAG: amidohydrolase family protein [Candidatus Rokubacteria bacterium]|nr:amidohydrolase family protein [Candidatus Rokubacteria bacterium]MBI3826458.1 amidohydrolase family protein [Candidatus Rokubacteria bacterium]